MAKRQWRPLMILFVAATGAIGISTLCAWHFRWKPWLVFEKTRYGNMRHIAAAMSEFAVDKERLPTDLKEVVREGYLPERSPIYRCPLLHNSLRDKAILYVDCEFDIQFQPNQVVISVPRSNLARGRLREAPAYLLECRIDKSGNVISP